MADLKIHYRLRGIAGTSPMAYEFFVGVPDHDPVVSTHDRSEILKWVEVLRSDADVVMLGKTRLLGRDPQRARLAEYLELVVSYESES